MPIFIIIAVKRANKFQFWAVPWILSHPVTVYFMKKLFSDISRKCIFADMTRTAIIIFGKMHFLLKIKILVFFLLNKMWRNDKFQGLHLHVVCCSCIWWEIAGLGVISVLIFSQSQMHMDDSWTHSQVVCIKMFIGSLYVSLYVTSKKQGENDTQYA